MENGGKPSMIILHTIKGKGCNFAQGVKNNHSMSFTQAQYDSAVAEMEKTIADCRAAL